MALNTMDYAGFYDVEEVKPRYRNGDPMEKLSFCQNSFCLRGHDKRYLKRKMIKAGDFLVCSKECEKAIDKVEIVREG